ncbi:MAG TPA: CBS domain-containing protein [Steroidobacteraceae bacterium]|jgi:CBS domain-containing protein|nr:CBS domain-containing protein [Steroidobacteraceae bacterium]
MLLKDFCTTDVAYCGRDTTALAAATLMRTKHVGDLVVVDDADYECTPVGIVTDRDIIVRVLGNELDPGRVTVGEIMRTPVVLANQDEDVTEAIARMRAHRVRRLPITGPRGRLVGIVTLDDVLRQLVNDASALVEVIASERDQEQRTLR